MRRNYLEYERLSAALVRTLRGRMSQGMVNAGLKTTYNICSRWERGGKMPSWSEFRRFCAVVGVDLESVLRRYVFSASDSPLSSEEVCSFLMSNFTLRALSGKVGVPVSTLHGFRTGRSEVTLPLFLGLFLANYDLSLLLGGLIGDRRPIFPLQKMMSAADRTRELRIQCPEGSFVLDLLKVDGAGDLFSDRSAFIKDCLGISLGRQKEIFQYLVRKGFLLARGKGRYTQVSQLAESDGRADSRVFHASYVCGLRILRHLIRERNYALGRARMGFAFFPAGVGIEERIQEECILADRRINELARSEEKQRLKTSRLSVYGLQIFPIAEFEVPLGNFGTRAPKSPSRDLFSAIASELVEAVSQKGRVRRREAVSGRVAWREFRALCQASGLDLDRALKAAKVTGSDPLSLLLTPDLAMRSGYSRSLIQRWQSGAVEMSLIAVLIFLDLNGRLFDFFRALLGGKELPSARAHFERRWSSHVTAKRDPLVPLGLIALRGLGASASEGVEPGLIGRASGISATREAGIFRTLGKLGIVGAGGDLDRAPFELAKGYYRLKKFWFDFNLKNFSDPSAADNVFQGLFMRPCSPEGMRRVDAQIRCLYERVLSVIDAHPPSEFSKVSMFSLQLIEPGRYSGS